MTFSMDLPSSFQVEKSCGRSQVLCMAGRELLVNSNRLHDNHGDSHMALHRYGLAREYQGGSFDRNSLNSSEFCTGIVSCCASFGFHRPGEPLE